VLTPYLTVKAALVGANTVNGPVPDKIVTNPVDLLLLKHQLKK
jgi:hypothetical protein